jgi:hypothetical protein
MASIIDFSTLNIPSDTVSESDSYGGALITIEPDFPELNIGAIAIVPIGNFENTGLLLREVKRLDEVGDYDFTEIQISRGLDQHPSATATFYSYNQPLVTIGTPVRLMEINFIISSYTIIQYKSTIETAYSVTLSLTGQHAPLGAETPLHELDIPIRLPHGTTRITWADIQSRLSTQISIGESSYTKYFAPDTEVIVTPRAEMESALLLSNNQCLIYSEPIIRGVSLTNGIGSIEIDRIYILNETTETSVKEIPIYKNTELELEDISVESIDDGEVTTRYEYENCTSFANLHHPGGTEGIILLSNFADDLKDPGNVFDNGGRTKTARTIKEKDGNPLTVVEETWGYVFISSQLFILPEDSGDYSEMVANGGKWPLNFSPLITGSISNYWKQVEQTTTLYYYDSDGYLTSSRKTGWKLGRLKREGGDYEAANLWIDTFYDSATSSTSTDPLVENGPPPEWKAKAREYNAYTFYNPIQYAGDNPVFPNINETTSAPLFKYNIFERTGYLLADMTDYYDDIEVPNGSAPNKFVYHTSSYSNVQEIQPNPKDDPEDPGSPYPPLIAHKERKDSSQTQILIPESVGADKKTPELFCTIDYSHSVEGDHSSSSIMIGNSTQYSGRPSVHTKLPDPDREGIELPSGYANDRTYRYFLSSVPEEPEDPNNNPPAVSSGSTSSNTFDSPVPYSSVSFSGAVTPESGKKAALNSLIKRSMDVHTTQIRVMFFRYYKVLKEGVKCTVDGQEYIITNISYNLKQLQDGLYYCPDEMTLSLSAIPIQSVSMTRYRRNDVNGSNGRSSIFA